MFRVPFLVQRVQLQFVTSVEVKGMGNLNVKFIEWQWHEPL
jgi:hypothetical protein